MKDKGGKEEEDKKEQWSCQGGGKKSGRKNENIPKIFFVRKIHEGFCSITMQTPLLLLKSLNEDERKPKSL